LAKEEEIHLLQGARKSVDYHNYSQSRLLFASFGFLAIIFAIYGGLLLYKSSVMSQLKNVVDQLVANEEARSLSDEKNLLKVNDNLAVVLPILNSHIYVSEAYSRFQQDINSQVQIESLGVKTGTGEFTFKALAASFSVVAKQIAAFYADGAISDVVISKIMSMPTGQIEFSGMVIFDVDRTLKKNSVPKKTSHE